MKPDAPGARLARGVEAMLRGYGFATLVEFSPKRQRRVDVIALDKKGEIWIIECKSSRNDFLSDKKWGEYLEFADRFFFAVPRDFPIEVLPQESGLIFADAYFAEIMQEAPLKALSAPRRKKITLKFARDAALRVQKQAQSLEAKWQITS